MPISLTLPVRSWAALDAALEFFRQAPPAVKAAQRQARSCRLLHRLLLRQGVRHRYICVGHPTPGKTLLRLHVRHKLCHRIPLTLDVPLGVGRRLAEVCLTIIHVQREPAFGMLMDHEMEELQAARAFLTELRRRGHCRLTVLPGTAGRRQLCWDESRREYGFADQLAQRVEQHYLWARSSLN